jgi:hypothetical protein
MKDRMLMLTNSAFLIFVGHTNSVFRCLDVIWSVALNYRGIHSHLLEGERGGYASAKQIFPRKIGTAAVRDHGIITRRADAAEPSRCRRTRRG